MTSEIQRLTRQVIGINSTIDGLEEQLRALKAQREKILIEDLPMALTTQGVDKAEFEYSPGEQGSPRVAITLKRVVSYTLPRDERSGVALDWLREHSGGDIIKNQLAVDVGRGGDNAVTALEAEMERLGLSGERKTTVHPQTLSKFMRERMEEGLPVPTDETFNHYIADKAEIKIK